MLLVGCPLVGIAGRHRNAVDSYIRHIVQKTGDPLWLGRIEQRRVDVDAETAGLCRPDRGDGAIVDPALTDRAVVIVTVTVEMDRPGKKGIWLKQLDLLREQQRIGAEIKKFLFRDQLSDDLVDFTVQQWFAARDYHDGCTAFVGGPDTF